MIGWIRMSKPFDNNNTFCGMMTIPRECFIENEIFRTYPIEEFNDKRKGRLKDLKNTKNLYDIEFKIKDNFNMTLFADINKTTDSSIIMILAWGTFLVARTDAPNVASRLPGMCKDENCLSPEALIFPVLSNRDVIICKYTPR